MIQNILMIQKSIDDSDLCAFYNDLYDLYNFRFWKYIFMYQIHLWIDDSNDSDDFDYLDEF